MLLSIVAPAARFPPRETAFWPARVVRVPGLSMRNRLIVVGSANVDVTVAVPRHPRPGETVLGGDSVVSPGGKGANTAVAAARAGADVALLGAVGVDAHGELLLGALTEAGVDIGLIRRADAPSGAAYITVDPAGENAIVVAPGANSQVSVADVDRDRPRIEDAGVLFAVLEVPLETVRHAVAVAAAAEVRVVLNASPVADLERATLAALDPLILNQHEAAVLLQESGETHRGPDLALRLLDLGPRSVVVTLGAEGAVVADSSGVTEVPAPQVDVVDTTGAGDAFAGALCAHLAAGQDLVAAARAAVVQAAEAVTRSGAQ